MSNPKEKAKELVDKFMGIDEDSEQFDGFKMGFFYAQRCVLIAIDEIIKEHYPQDAKRCEYWNQVEQEIEKL